MILVACLALLALVVVYQAVMVLSGWFMPAAAHVRFRRGVGAIGGFLARLSIVIAAGAIIWLGVIVYQGMPPV